MKTCNRCLREKEKLDFHRNKRSKDGLNGICKQCVKESVPKIEPTCSLCDKQFIRVKSDYNPDSRIFCGQECRIEWLKCVSITNIIPRKEFTCDNCGEIFKRLASQVNGKHHIYCSRGCQYKGNSKYHSGKDSYHWNHEKPIEERITDRKYEAYYEWRKKVYERDVYTCVKCGDNKGGNLHAHHIYNYAEHLELRTVLSNGITLCEDCHSDFHLTYGFTKNNQRQLDEFLTKESVS